MDGKVVLGSLKKLKSGETNGRGLCVSQCGRQKNKEVEKHVSV